MSPVRLHRTALILALSSVALCACLSLSGCAGGLAGLLLLDKWEDWFGKGTEDPLDYRVFVDGYDIVSSATASGILDLRGLEPRDYLLTVSRPPEHRRGLQAVVAVESNGRVDLRNQNLFEGGTISGKVRRDTPTGALLPDVRVIAIKDGAALLAGGKAPISIPPQTSAINNIRYMLGYTDDSGAYRLGPAEFGNWLVVATQAGFTADVAYTSVRAGANGIANLVLEADGTVQTGVVTGSVASGATPLDSPLITAFLDAPYVPQIPAAVRNEVRNQSGANLPAGDWFEFATLTTIAPGTRSYALTLPVGTHSIEAFAFRYIADSADAVVTSGGAAALDFALRHR